MGNTVGQIVTVLTAIVGVAILAVLVSRNSQTPAVIKSVGDAFATSLQAATGPAMGGGGGLGSLNLGSLNSF